MVKKRHKKQRAEARESAAVAAGGPRGHQRYTGNTTRPGGRQQLTVAWAYDADIARAFEIRDILHEPRLVSDATNIHEGPTKFRLYPDSRVFAGWMLEWDETRDSYWQGLELEEVLFEIGFTWGPSVVRRFSSFIEESVEPLLEESAVGSAWSEAQWAVQQSGTMPPVSNFEVIPPAPSDTTSDAYLLWEDEFGGLPPDRLALLPRRTFTVDFPWYPRLAVEQAKQLEYVSGPGDSGALWQRTHLGTRLLASVTAQRVFAPMSGVVVDRPKPKLTFTEGVSEDDRAVAEAWVQSTYWPARVADLAARAVGSIILGLPLHGIPGVTELDPAPEFRADWRNADPPFTPAEDFGVSPLIPEPEEQREEYLAWHRSVTPAPRLKRSTVMVPEVPPVPPWTTPADFPDLVLVRASNSRAEDESLPDVRMHDPVTGETLFDAPSGLSGRVRTGRFEFGGEEPLHAGAWWATPTMLAQAGHRDAVALWRETKQAILQNAQPSRDRQPGGIRLDIEHDGQVPVPTWSGGGISVHPSGCGWCSWEHIVRPAGTTQEFVLAHRMTVPEYRDGRDVQEPLIWFEFQVPDDAVRTVLALDHNYATANLVATYAQQALVQQQVGLPMPPFEAVKDILREWSAERF
ncbi:hypothetical protein ACWGJ9_08300 [Curtobacterium citreum]